MNYRPFVSYGVYGAASASEMRCYFASYGLLGDAPEPVPVVTSFFRIPTIPIHPTWPTIGRFGLLSLLAFLIYWR
jgi:hypothetical protein